jgi:hypothetical protein
MRRTQMAVVQKSAEHPWFSDKEALLRFLEEQDTDTGFVFDPNVTPEKVYEMMLAQGIRPEDNILSRDSIRARYEDEG